MNYIESMPALAFSIVGSKGDYKVSGRLTGKGQIVSEQPLGILFEITGTVCLR